MNTQQITPNYCECGCGKPVRKPHHRYLQGHNSKAAGLTPEQRFWAMVDKRGWDECWHWQGATRNGYGVLNIEHKVVYAHRFSYELHHGPLADGMNALHECDVNYPPGDISYRRCCNPYHLFSGTKGDNMRDMYAKGRGNTSGNARGSTPKLTEEQVRTIRTLAAQGVKYPALAKRFGVTIPTISLIVTHKRWKHV